jgi:hypothetical protein
MKVSVVKNPLCGLLDFGYQYRVHAGEPFSGQLHHGPIIYNDSFFEYVTYQKDSYERDFLGIQGYWDLKPDVKNALAPIPSGYWKIDKSTRQIQQSSIRFWRRDHLLMFKLGLVS